MAVKIEKAGSISYYTPKDQLDLPEGERTRYHMKRLTRRVQAQHRDGTIKFSRGTLSGVASATVALDLVLASLCGWDNVLNENGEKVVFSLDSVENLYDMIPREHQDELEEKFGQMGIDKKSAEKAADSEG